MGRKKTIGRARYGSCFIKGSDIVVITTSHREYKNNPAFIETLLHLSPAFILDTVGVLADPEIEKLAVRHTIKILGRGDI
jgi:UDP-N-acetyl-D-mannosaminuronate dehydrogenase